MRAPMVFRIRIIFAFLFLFAAVLVGRLYMVQIIYGDSLSEQADRQYVRTGSALYDRGSIFFEDKDGRLVSAATLATGYTVALNPRLLENPLKTYEALAPLIDLDTETFFIRAGKKDDPYEEIARRIPEDQAREIEALGLSGVNIYKERWRLYPGKTTAAQTIGFVGYQGDELAGRYGLERYYEDILTRNASGVYVNFFAEIFANIGSAIFTGEGSSPGDIETTLEPSVELFLEQTLAEVAARWNARETGGIIIDPRSGAIYALGVHPAFDPNRLGEVESPDVFGNPLVESVFEMGSIIKPLTVAAGLDAGVITAKTTYLDEGHIALNGAIISNFDGKGRGRVSMQEVLNQSLNTGVSFVAQKLGKEKMREYFTAFGLGEETGIDLPNEARGLIQNLESPRDLEYATASFGQGIAMTPIATVRALTALANRGVLATPHIAQRIRYESGLSKTISFPDGPRVLAPESAEEITRMLVEVVDTALLDGTAKNPHYSIAAKTGTAQIAKENGRGYYEDRYLHSFFGYFPAYEPRFLVFLYVREPKEVRYASQTLTRPFLDIAQFLINYYEIPPDR